MLTKEVDFWIAKTYVALADDEKEQETYAVKCKEVPDTAASLSRGVESLAIERYLDDLEWEIEELKAGRNMNIRKFHFSEFGRLGEKFSGSKVITEDSFSRVWWPWNIRKH